MSKRVWKLDSGEDVFEADDMMKWEGGWTLWVEARRQRRGDSRVCPRCNPHVLVLPRGHPVHPQPRESQAFGDLRDVGVAGQSVGAYL